MKTLNIGLIGAGFMAKAHSVAYAGMPMFFWPAPAIPFKKTIADINEAAARDAAEKFAFASYTTDWHDIINDPDIDVVDICTPNNVHAEIAIAAARSGNHILCPGSGQFLIIDCFTGNCLDHIRSTEKKFTGFIYADHIVIQNRGISRTTCTGSHNN